MLSGWPWIPGNNPVHNPDYNLNLLGIMLEELEDYLLSDEIFWPLGGNPMRGGPPFPNLSVGQLQLTIKELEAVEDDLDAEHSMQWSKYRDRAWALRSKWTTAMAQKSLAEASQRANLWKAYLGDIKEAGGSSGNYPYEVRHRVILELLFELTELLDDDELKSRVSILDGMLRGILSGPSEFIWEEPLSRVYPRDQYWFLYQRPRQRQDA
jgi:hypothetical protein